MVAMPLVYQQGEKKILIFAIFCKRDTLESTCIYFSADIKTALFLLSWTCHPHDRSPLYLCSCHTRIHLHMRGNFSHSGEQVLPAPCGVRHRHKALLWTEGIRCGTDLLQPQSPVDEHCEHHRHRTSDGRVPDMGVWTLLGPTAHPFRQVVDRGLKLHGSAFL